MNLLREFTADWLALPEVQFLLKWWWLQLALFAAVFLALAWFTRSRG